MGAMLPLQFGIELSITRTSQHIEIGMQMKREAIERCTPPVPVPAGDSPWYYREDIIQWLEDL